MMACKPYQIEGVLSEIKEELKGKALISIAAGWNYDKYEEYLDKSTRFQFIMPNTPAMVGEGVLLFEEKNSLLPEEREEIIADIKRHTELVKAYEDAANTAKEAQEMCEKNLRKLRRESKEVVENMKVKKQLKEVYDDMDELKNVTATDKLLDSVRDKNKDLDAVVEGAKVVHNNKMSTRLTKAEVEARKNLAKVSG